MKEAEEKAIDLWTKREEEERKAGNLWVRRSELTKLWVKMHQEYSDAKASRK